MSIVKTLKVSLGGVKTGSVQLQSTELTREYASSVSSQLTTKTTLPDSNSYTTSKTGMSVVRDDHTVTSNIPLTVAVDTVKQGRSVIQSTFGKSTTVPSYIARPVNSMLKSSNVVSVVGTSLLTNFEKLTGIDRTVNISPMIIMSTRFLPLYKDDMTTTDVADYLSFRRTLSNLRLNDITKLMNQFISSMDSITPDNTSKKSLIGPSTDPQTRFISLYNAVKTTANDVEYMYSVRGSAETTKLSLDISSDKNLIQQSYETELLLDVFTLNGFDYTQNGGYLFTSSDKIFNPNTVSMIDFFVKTGFISDDVSVWSYTKVWKQFLLESFYEYSYSGIHRNYITYESDTTNNRSNSFLTKKDVSTLHIPSIISHINIGKQSVFQLLMSSDVEGNIFSIIDFYSSLYKSVKFSDESYSKISTLIDSVSKEVRYSKFNKKQKIKTSSAEESISNIEKIIIGTSTSSDSFDTSSDGSFADLSLVNESIGTVALFEPFVVTSNANITPGHEFYIESAFDVRGSRSFNTTNVEKIRTRLQIMKNSFVSFVSDSNILGLSLPKGTTLDADNPVVFINRMIDEISNTEYSVKKNLQSTNVDKQPLIVLSLMSLAASSTQLRSIIFSLLMVLFSKNENIADLISTYTPFLQYSLTSILESAEDGSSTTGFSISIYDIVNSLTNNLAIQNGFLKYLFDVFGSFKRSSIVSEVDELTEFSHISYTSILAVIFDAMCSTASILYDGSFISYKKVSNSNVLFMISLKDVDYSFVQLSIVNSVKSSVDISRMSASLIFGQLRSFLESFTSYTQKLSNSDQVVDRILTLLDNDTDLFSEFISDGQLKLSHLQSNDLLHRLKTFSESDKTGGKLLLQDRNKTDTITLLSNIVPTEKQESCVRTSFTDPKFRSSEGFNKQIISIGIPSTIVSSLKRRTFDTSSINKTKQSSVKRTSDIIRLNVYKTDNQYIDLVFKPQTFLFQLSRFVFDIDYYIKTLPTSPTLESVILSLPTVDLSGMNWSQGSGDSLSKFYGYDAMLSDDYLGLSDDQKKEIIRNHVMSDVLGLYMKLLTGIDVSEKKFPIRQIQTPMIDSSTASFIVDSTLRLASIKDSSVSSEKTHSRSIFQSASVSESETLRIQSTATANSNVDLLSDKAKSYVEQSLINISALFDVPTKFSDETAVSKMIVIPKKFDRIFNIAVDPDDFEIDKQKTTISSAVGKSLFDELLSTNEIITASVPRSHSETSTTIYRMKQHTTSEGYYSFEKYFSTIDVFIDEVTK